MNRSTFAITSLVLGFVICAVARPAAHDDMRGTRYDPDQALRQQLDRVLPHVKFTGKLADAIDYLHNLTRANFSVNWPALEACGVNDMPVKVALDDIRFSKALQLILDQAKLTKVSYEINDGVIVISTGDDLGRITPTRIYDIRELLTVIPDFEDYPAALPGQTGDIDFDEPANSRWAERQPMRAERVDNIIKKIEELAASDSWKESGGQIGSIGELDGFLFVTQTPSNHEQVKDLLEQIAANQSRMVRVPAIWVVARPTEISGIIKKVPAPPTTQKSQAGPLLAVETRDLEKLSGPRCEAQTLTMTGQRARVSSAYQQPWVRPNELGGAADHAATYNTRVWLDAETALSNDGQYARIILRPQAVDQFQDADDSPDNSNNMTTQEFKINVRLPVGKLILIGSTTLTAEPGQTDTPKLFLFVEVTSQ